MSYRVILLGKQDRSAFESGSEPLDRYFRERVTQDVRRRVASCFVALDDADRIAGFYTIAATSLVLDKLPDDQAKRLPRYPVVPAVLLGRLAVATAYQGKRLGGALVADALLRAARSEVMAYAMIVEAKDEPAARFYEHLGFTRLGEERLRLLRPLEISAPAKAHRRQFDVQPTSVMPNLFRHPLYRETNGRLVWDRPTPQQSGPTAEMVK